MKKKTRELLTAALAALDEEDETPSTTAERMAARRPPGNGHNDPGHPATEKPRTNLARAIAARQESYLREEGLR